MDKYEVTIGEYKKFQEATGYLYPEDVYRPMEFIIRDYYKFPQSLPEDIDDYPITNIQYPDAVAYAEWAGKRLPTKHEWEFAARGGNPDARYTWGNTPPYKGHRLGNFLFSDSIILFHRSKLEPVGQYEPNPYKLHDLTGNAAEWVASRTNEWQGKIGRILKGGAYANKYHHPPGSHVANDQIYIDLDMNSWGTWDRGTTASGIGFRCVKDIE